MVANYFFDTGFLTLAITNRLLEKWIRPWKEVKKGQKICHIIEPVVAETYYQLMGEGIDKEGAKIRIIQLKAINHMSISKLDDNDSFRAAHHHTQFRKLGLSLVDCFILAVAARHKLKVYTTDHPLKNAVKRINVPCDYLPVSTL